MADSGNPLVIASGTLLLPLGRVVNETDLPDPASPAAYRAHFEKTAIDFAEKGVRTSVIRLPPTVHGDGDYGFIPRLITLAQKTGVSACVNDGQNYWPAVHRLDVWPICSYQHSKKVLLVLYITELPKKVFLSLKLQR